MAIHRADPAPEGGGIELVVDGAPVTVPDDGSSLLAVLRERLGVTSVKDGCSPQGQCGCCTVLVDGAPRVSCVTPVRRVAGRVVTTVDGLGDEDRRRWADAFLATGASQCGFCTPGIICRLEGLRARAEPDAVDRGLLERALSAHLCRCTGWQTIVEAWGLALRGASGAAAELAHERDMHAAERRAALEGGASQRVGADVALGRGGFADDAAPHGALVAVPDARGGWALGETLAEARAAAGKIQGRRSTRGALPPLDVPAGEWELTLRTSWVEPAYLETDASWCLPGGEPASPLANGGAFGAKRTSPVAEVARRLADLHGRPVRVLLSREDTVRTGPKRPPVAAGIRADGTGVIRVVRTDGVADAVRSVAPGLVVEQVDVPGPPTSVDIRAAGWAEAAVLLAALQARRDGVDGTPSRLVAVRAPNGAAAEAAVGADGTVRVRVECGEVLDPVVLRSYVIGAAHMGLGWVTGEALAVEDGEVRDLTIRSFGILRAGDMPHVDVELVAGSGEPVNGSDAVFAAVAAAAWVARGCPPSWPVRS